MIDYRVKPAKGSFAPGEAIRIELRLVNTGPGPVDIASPEAAGDRATFVVSGPGETAVRYYNASSLLSNELRIAPPPERVSLQPGGVWDGSLLVGRQQGVGEPGIYKVAARFEDTGRRWQTQPVDFTVETLMPRGFAIGNGVTGDGAAAGHIAMLHEGAGGRFLYVSQFVETRPDLAEAEVGRPMLLTALGAGAFDASMARRNGPYFDEREQWAVWREAQGVVAISTLGERRIARMSSPPTLLATPALKPAADGALQVAVASADPPAMTLLLFPSQPLSAAQPAWTLRLPASPEFATGALEPVDEGSSGHIAAVANSPEGVMVSHVRYSGTRIPAGFDTVTIPGCHTLPGSRAGIHGGPGGVGLVGLFVESAESVGSISFVEVEFPASAFGGIREIVEVGKPAGTLLSSAVLYQDSRAGTPVRRTAAVHVSKGIFQLAGGQLRASRVSSGPVSPLLLAEGQAVVFVMVLGEDGSPELIPL